MPPVRSSAFKCCACVIIVIFLLGEIMSICFCYIEKKLVHIVIIAPSSHQPSFYIKCTKLNIYLSCNIRLVFNTKYISRFLYNIYSLS